MPVQSGIDAEVDTRRFAVASFEIFDEMEGDPVVVDHGNGWYDCLSKSHMFGRFTPDRFNLPHLEYKEKIGLTCRPFVTPQHTQKAHWTTWTSTGTPWDERGPTSGYFAVRRLIQQDASPGLRYRADSNFYLPANPHVAFSLVLDETPSDWDPAPGQEPYTQIDLGVLGSMGQWAIRLDKQGNRLLYNLGGVWMAVADLPSGGNPDYGDMDEKWFIVRCLGGSICISTDFGKTYEVFAFPEEAPTEIRSGRLRLHGQGGRLGFGLHQIAYYTGTYRSATCNTFTSRLFGGPTFSHRSYVPTGTQVTIQDLSNPVAAYMQYGAQLTPTTSPGIPFRFHSCPVLYATRAVFPIQATVPTNQSDRPWDNHLVGADVDKPIELEQSTCTVYFHMDAWELLEGNYRFRKVKVHLGHKSWDGEVEYPYEFSGYIRCVTEEWGDDWGMKVVKVTIDNHAIRFRRTEWWQTDVIPLGGLTVNQALDYILYTEGVPLNTSYRRWHILGDLLPMPFGTPDDPFELLQPGERKWETMRRIASYMGLELFVSDDGIIQTLPMEYVSPTVDKTYTSKWAEDKRDQIKKIEASRDYGDSCTAVSIFAEAEDGTGGLMVWAVDKAAEMSVLAGRSCPWREGVQETVRGTTAPWVMVQRAQMLAYKHFPIKHRADLSAPVDITLSRRMRVAINGCEGVGIPEGTEYVLLNLRHSYRARESFSTLETSAGLQRLN